LLGIIAVLIDAHESDARDNEYDRRFKGALLSQAPGRRAG
jgi:hypothetical protein